MCLSTKAFPRLDLLFSVHVTLFRCLLLPCLLSQSPSFALAPSVLHSLLHQSLLLLMKIFYAASYLIFNARCFSFFFFWKDYIASTTGEVACRKLCCLSLWSRGLRPRSTAVRLLGSWVRIPPAALTFVCCEYCVCCQVQASVTSWPLVQGSPNDCGASLCVTSKPHE